MYDDSLMNCWIINELSSKYEPYERYQVLICNDKIDPSDRYQYYPSISDECEIAAQVNITRIKKKFNINKMYIYNKEYSDKLIGILLDELNDYAISRRYRYIYTTRTQFIENSLGNYGFTYYEKNNLYRRKVVRRK